MIRRQWCLSMQVRQTPATSLLGKRRFHVDLSCYIMRHESPVVAECLPNHGHLQNFLVAKQIIDKTEVRHLRYFCRQWISTDERYGHLWPSRYEPSDTNHFSAGSEVRSQGGFICSVGKTLHHHCELIVTLASKSPTSVLL